MYILSREEMEEFADERTSAVQNLIDSLLGSVNDFNIEEWTQNELDKLTNDIFNCEDCGWWFEIGEMATTYDGRQICVDCGEEND